MVDETDGFVCLCVSLVGYRELCKFALATLELILVQGSA